MSPVIISFLPRGSTQSCTTCSSQNRVAHRGRCLCQKYLLIRTDSENPAWGPHGCVCGQRPLAAVTRPLPTALGFRPRGQPPEADDSEGCLVRKPRPCPEQRISEGRTSPPWHSLHPQIALGTAPGSLSAAQCSFNV